MRIFLCGDVMTGRGVDQILACPCSPEIHEPYVSDAREYVALAEHVNGPIPRSVGPAYIWGDALDELEHAAPEVRIVNLETSVTQESAWEPKGINYRMHPQNVACLTRARVDVCVLANNHVLDYGTAGLEETLDTLQGAGIGTAGAGRTLEAARRPAIVAGRRGRVRLVAVGAESSGIPRSWQAGPDRPGIDLLPGLTDAAADDIAGRATRARTPGDVAIVSIHWGGNWGYEVPPAHVRFAHALIDRGVDIVYGHSSHHPRPIERYRGRLVLYGCGDFIHDYEGIAGYEEFRDDLVLMYFPRLDPASGALVELRMSPMRIRNMRLNRASPDEAEGLRATLDRISAAFDVRIRSGPDGRLELT